MWRRSAVLAILFSVALIAQTSQPEAQPSPGWRPAEAAKPAGDFVVPTGTRIPLSLINSISTKHSAVGDRVYLQTAFPVLVNGKIVIPAGSYVLGTVTSSKRPGKVKGRGELYVRFDSLTLGVNAGQVYLAKHRISSLLKKEIVRLEREVSWPAGSPARTSW